jgi:hypothetical protein
MSPILDHSGTHPPSLLGLLSKSNPAVVASATDVVSPLEQLIELDDSAVNVTTATVKHAHPVYLREPVAPSELDPWFHKTIAAISSYRGVKDGWDGHDAVAPSKRHSTRLRCSLYFCPKLARIGGRCSPSTR